MTWQEYENSVYKYVKNMADNRTLPTGEHYEVKQHEKYYVSNGRIIDVDVSIEVYLDEKRDRWSQLIIFECKHVGKNLDISDMDEWESKIRRFGSTGHKLYIVTPGGFTPQEIKDAMSSRIGLVVWDGTNNWEWKVMRSYSQDSAHDLNYEILKGEHSAPGYPLVYDEYCFETLPMSLKDNNIQCLNKNTLVVPYITKEKIWEVVKALLQNRDICHIATKNIEDKIIAYLGYSVWFIDMPEGEVAKTDFGSKTIYVSNAQNTLSSRLRFSIAHEIGHIILHKEILTQYFQQLSQDGTTQFASPNDKQSKKLEYQANKFASYLLMPKQSFAYAVVEVFRRNNLSGMKFVVDNQPFKQSILKNVLNELTKRFEVSKDSVKIRMLDEGFLEIKDQPQRVSGISHDLF